MASLTQWTWVWANSGRWWWTGKPGMQQFMGSQRVEHDWATEQKQQQNLFILLEVCTLRPISPFPPPPAPSNHSFSTLCFYQKVSRTNLKKLKNRKEWRELNARVLSLFSLVWLFCDPMDCSPPGSSVHGILEARILKWVAISFSRRSSWPRDQTCISCVSCIGRQILHPLSHLGSFTQNCFSADYHWPRYR